MKSYAWYASLTVTAHNDRRCLYYCDHYMVDDSSSLTNLNIKITKEGILPLKLPPSMNVESLSRRHLHMNCTCASCEEKASVESKQMYLGVRRFIELTKEVFLSFMLTTFRYGSRGDSYVLFCMLLFSVTSDKRTPY